MSPLQTVLSWKFSTLSDWNVEAWEYQVGVKYSIRGLIPVASELCVWSCGVAN